MFEFNEETELILGRPNFVCGAIAQQLRSCGKEIPPKAEKEQAAVIYWLLEMYEQHGNEWDKAAYQWIKDNQPQEQSK